MSFIDAFLEGFRSPPRPARRQLIGADGWRALGAVAMVLLAAALFVLVVLYPDGIAAWDHGHLSLSLDR